MAYEMVMPYHLHMPSYFLETFTEYPYFTHTGVRFSITDACFFLYLQNLFQYQLLLKETKTKKL